MHRIIPIMLGFLLLARVLTAQEAVAAAGGQMESPSGSLSWTLGEGIIGTLQGGPTVLTQGFQQTNLSATALVTITGADIHLTAFPNPVREDITIRLSALPPGQMEAVLFDMSGKRRASLRLSSLEQALPMSNLSPGTYLLSVLHRGRQVHTFHLVKP